MKSIIILRSTKWTMMVLLAAILFSIPAFSQEVIPVYSEVNLTLSSEADIDRLRISGVDLDHFHPELGKNRLVVRADELSLLDAAGLGYAVTEPNLAKAIEERNIIDAENYVLDPSTKTTAGFELGSMGGFYTYAEVLQQLDEMYSLYPNLITQRFSIGTTGEGRTIWAVKISDNPNTDESAAEVPVYFDALHHAREPASMATVINFMFHLLENYGSDPGLSYVVDNREIFIVPVVNPDGYEYNRQTNPNGGGFWRKNRRVNSGSSCRGVDINRNYDTDWAGASSSNPCSDSYHGTAVFSEPEAQAIRDFTTSIGAPISYTTHTSGGYWLGPDFSNNRSDFAIHVELMNDCMQENEYIHGDADIILGYVSGTTQGWLYEELGSLTWTPEIGTTGFWPSIPEIIPLVNQQLKPYEYACWVAGALADYQGFTVTSSQGLSSAGPLDLDITIKNKGLSTTAQNVNVVVTTDNPGVTVVAGSQSYGNIASRAFATNASPFTFTVAPSVPAGTVVTFFVDVSQEGVVSDSDSFQMTVGSPTVLFSDDAESGSGAWSNGGSGSTWVAADDDAYTGSNCFVDSRISHASGNRNFSTNAAISLAGTTNPRLEFAAKWSMYQKYTRLQISVNGGGWSNLSASGMGTANGGPAYVGNERWTYQVVDLSAYIGQSVRFRFANFGGGTNPDGFYFDDFRVVDYETAPTCNDSIQNGSETGVDCGGPDCGACPTCDDGVQNGSETGVDCGGPDCAACPTCDDGIQNGSETGVDCGGPDCAACPTCDDGIQNGSETGVDCGGPDCAACVTCDDGIQNGSETGVDCGGPDCAACPTCDDGIQNGSETGVDCGGPDCAACVTCDDGIQNGSETGVDCGGPDCAACPTCDDGIQNGSETGVDCGGPDCAACPTCDDGIQNGSETGVDCGGPDCAACPTCDDGIQNGSETGVDCGGPDCGACPTCDDGIQNGSETGVDCGGPDCAACVTCDDGIQNGSETGVDCGGPDCAACPTCDDGIQNGSETGVDCGGPDCAACITCDDGIQNGSETGVDCGGPDCGACPTCDDGIQNGSETGVDCGGPDCAACPTCDDGIQNGSETGVDCGGPDCAACPTCDDGIQNGSETGVDCGGPDCAACPTCDDGVQNGSETGVDCGGPDCAACPTCDDGIQNGDETGVDCGGSCAPCTGCTPTTIISDDFEAGYGNWNDGGSDCARVNSSTYAFSGLIALRLRDNSTSSRLTSDVLDLSAYTEIEVDFTYVPVSMDNPNEDFFLELSSNGGSSYTIIEEWNRGDEFENNIRYFENVVISGPFTSNSRLRFRCDASGNSDWIYLDDIVVTSCVGGSGGPTCDDGIQNGSETGVDCGGPDCGACPTCDDGIQNGSETGVDCGGPDCAACVSCNDGIQNGSETGVDCGGPDCAACPTCDDGIQNGSETGVDCGGPDCAACPVSYCSASASTQYEFIQSVTIGGTTNNSGNNGGYADFTGGTAFNLSGSTSVSLTPGFPSGAYNEFWTIFVDYNADGDFTDAGEQVFQGASSGTVTGSFTVPGGLSGSSRMRIMMQYNAYNSSSCGSFTWGEVEDYTVNFGGGSRRLTAPETNTKIVTAAPVLELFPNPARTDLTIRIPLEGNDSEATWMIIDASGKIVRSGVTPADALRAGLSISVRDLSAGIYYLSLNSTDGRATKRFIVQP